MKIITLNANGIRAASRKGVFQWLEMENPDAVCIQETKAQVHQLGPEFFPEGYHCHYVDAEKKGYSGVAIYSRIEPLEVVTSMDYALSDFEGRYIHMDLGKVIVASLYLPSGTSGDERQAVKYQFLDAMDTYLLSLKAAGKPIILCGDLNIVHKEIDIKNWKSNQKNSGCLPEERGWLDKLFGELGFVDAFREVNQEAGQYTWWSNRGQAYAKNVGWRIDYQVISDSLKGTVRSASVYKEQRFSDHAPLLIDYDLS